MKRITKPRIQALIDFLKIGSLIQSSDWVSGYAEMTQKRTLPMYCTRYYRKDIDKVKMPDEVIQFFKDNPRVRIVACVKDYFKAFNTVIRYYEQELKEKDRKIEELDLYVRADKSKL